MDTRKDKLQCYTSFLIKNLQVVVSQRLEKKPAIRCMPNQQLANELHQPIIRKFERRKVHFLFRDNILGVDLADM